MIFFFISILAGIFTVLAPCILPLLPVVIGASEEGSRGVSRRALTVIGSLSLSVVIFSLLLKATTLFIGIPQSFWTSFSGLVIVLVGLAIVFPSFWIKIPYINKLNLISNKAVGTGYQKKSYKGDMLIGLALGPVFTTCSPTFLFIIATVLPATFVVGFIYLLGFTLGLALSLLVIAFFGQQIVNKVSAHMETAGTAKRIFGVLILLVGVAVLTGYDKKIETWILNSGYGATIQLEDSLIEKFAPKESTLESGASAKGSSDASGLPNVKGSPETSEGYKTITLAGGCFWCTEAYFQEEKGIMSAVSGYAGGEASNAEYLLVAKGNTKHREAVQITYDPKIITTEQVLDIYWAHIDPTDAKGQFADKGYQYTTAIFYQDAEQEAIARDSKTRLEKSGIFTKAIATEVLPFTTFFKAEEYHQDYYKKAADHYEKYKKASGRSGFVEETWAKDAAIKFLQSEL